MATATRIISILFLLSACTTIPQKDIKQSQGTNGASSGTTAPPQIFQTAPSPVSAPPAAVPAPTPVPPSGMPQDSSAGAPAEVSVGVILGPGGVKALAQIGVLRELEKARVPVRGIVGLEWGALVGGLFASHGRTNDVEWQVGKLKPSDLPTNRMFGSEIKPVSVGNISEFLDQATAGRKVHESKIPFACPYLETDSDVFQMADQGHTKDVLINCLPFPPVFEVKNRAASPFSVRPAVRWLKSKGVQKIILVNVLPQGPITRESTYTGDEVLETLWKEVRNQMRQDKEGVDWVIDVPTKGFSFHQIESLRSLVAAGSRTTASQMTGLKRRFGIP